MRKEDKNLVIENSEIYLYYKERLINLALAQFQWSGLPDTCDRRWLERCLLYEGKVAFMKPKYVDDDTWVSVNFVNTAGFDIYGYPTAIRGIGFNGENIETDEFEVLYDNMTWTTLMPKIDLYARLLWEVHTTFRSNLQQQLTPYIVATNKNTLLGMRNFFNRVIGRDNVIEVRNMDTIDDSIKTFNLGVQFRGNEMLECLKVVWNEALSMLGITAETTKKERLISDEIVLDRQEDILSLNARLLNRVDFCNKMNEQYGWDISVNLSSVDTELKVFGDYAQRLLEKNSGVATAEASNVNWTDMGAQASRHLEGK